jgi:hypothetical protein
VTKVGRWILIALLGFYGVIEILAGIAFITGAVKVPMEDIAVPPGQEQLFVYVAAGVTLFFGVLLLVAAWGVWSWRPWARILCIIAAGFMLFSIVVMSFQRPLPAAAYVALAVAVAMLAWLFNSEVVNSFKTGGQQA